MIQKPVAIDVPATHTSLQDTLSSPAQLNGTMAPTRPAPIISRSTQNQLLQLQNTVSNLQTQVTSAATSATANPPAIVTSLAATESPYKTADGSVRSLVSVSFADADTSAVAFDIYLTGYYGSAFQFATTGVQSPISFECDVTKETVTVTVVSKNANNESQPIQTAPTTTVTLDGVVSAPPPPSIAQALTETVIGYSFAFNVEGGLLADVISGYNVYRNTSDTFTGASQIQHIAQPPTNSGAIQVSDPQPSSTTAQYYWVTSVNTSGLESTPTSAGNPTGDGIPQQVTGVSAVESPYKTQSGQMVSLVAVDFTPALNDPFFDTVEVYFTGYNGNANPQLMAQGSVSPLQFLAETTHEVVTVTVVAVSANDVTSDFATAPTTMLALDGVMSAPPAPSIATPQVALAGNVGWQFSFNVIGGLESDLIAGYRVYHSESNITPIPPNNYYKAIPQPTTNVGQIVVQEVTPDLNFYWISSYNLAGLESVLTPVPFVYVDPGDPAPPTPSPVQTTKTYAPTLSLNGWGPNAHVGYWEPSDYTYVFGTESTSVNAFTNPTSAYDGNQSTAAGASYTHTAQYAGCVWSFSNFPGLASGNSIVSASFAVVSEVLPTAGPVHGQGSIWYSTDAGSTWTSVYTAISSQRLKKTDTVTLSTSINPTQLQIMAFAHSHDDLAMNVYEINLSITQQGPAGPEKVPGVVATLVGGNVQVSWNALTPLTRTDITAYEVTRTVKGGGYAQSHVHATITPNGSASYSWTDVSAHDGTYDYWVVAVNSTGASTPSDVAHITGATSMIYTTGNTIESLRPAEAGAEVTTGKSLTVLADRNLDNIADGSTGRTAQLTYTLGNYSASTWIKLGTWINSGAGSSLTLNLYTGNGFNSGLNQQSLVTIQLRSGNAAAAPNLSGATAMAYGNGPLLALKVAATGGSTSASNNSWDVYIETSPWSGGHYTAAVAPGQSWISIGASASDPGAASSTVVVGTVSNVVDAGGNLYGSLTINGTSASPVALSGVHDRVSKTILSAGGIDFLSSLHANKNLGSIADGGGRYAASESGANVTSGHILTAVSTSSNPNQALTESSYGAIPSLGFTAVASGTADVYNFYGSISLTINSTGVSIAIAVDGSVISSSERYYTKEGTCPYFASVTGLSPGSHTITVVANADGAIDYQDPRSTYMVCQRIY